MSGVVVWRGERERGETANSECSFEINTAVKVSKPLVSKLKST